MGSMISKGSEEGGQKGEKLLKLYVGVRAQRRGDKKGKAPKALRRSKGSEEGGQKGEKLLKLYVGARAQREVQKKRAERAESSQSSTSEQGLIGLAIER